MDDQATVDPVLERRNEEYRDLVNQVFQMGPHDPNRLPPQVGEPDHPLNVEKLRALLGCIDGICTVEIEPAFLSGPNVVIRHEVRPHIRRYSELTRSGQEGPLLGEQRFDQSLSYQTGVDPYMLDRSNVPVEDFVAYLAEKIRHLHDVEWPHHA